MQRLAWFTDHRAQTHSRNIISVLGKILDRLQFTSSALNPHELYVLLSACYLHDIGMQDFRLDKNGRGVDSYTEKDYNRIRKLHPQRGRDLILYRTIRRERDEFIIDLDYDLPYLVPIALVSQGHGTEFFAESIDALRESNYSPGNETFRGDLLAALLLLGDELDLHQDRATFPQEYSLSPISLMHHYVHHFVQRIDVIDGLTSKHRRIVLSFNFPPDGDGYAPYVLEWVVSKLRRQSELTKTVVESSTDGELTWDPHIDVSNVTTDQYGVRRSFFSTPTSRKALHLLTREVINSRTVNREELTEAIESGIDQSRTAYRVIRVLQPNRERSDWPHLAERLAALCDTKEALLIPCWLSGPHRSRSRRSCQFHRGSTNPRLS